MKKAQPEIDGGRRGFFRAVAGAGVVAGSGALILRGAPQRAEAGKKTPATSADASYRETDHIRKYYETARG
ncbi:MAG: hypothetical protein U5K33_05795 [Halofilum sp. (in: g-proteobacteria)]|nr:hypothetical protein [Halofilum sp. (in: g-proteobacteria)]